MTEYSVGECKKLIKDLEEELDEDEYNLECAKFDIKRTKKKIKFWKKELHKANNRQNEKVV